MLNECYNAIKDDIDETTPCGKLIAAHVLSRYLNEGLRLPVPFAMQTMVMTYFCSLNDPMKDADKLDDDTIVARLYPGIQF